MEAQSQLDCPDACRSTQTWGAGSIHSLGTGRGLLWAKELSLGEKWAGNQTAEIAVGVRMGKEGAGMSGII